MTRVALVVGINTYTHFPDLKAPAQDAEAIAQRLQQDGDFKVHRLPEALVREGEQLSPAVGETLSVPQAQLEASLKQLFRPDSAQIRILPCFTFRAMDCLTPRAKRG
ncbi:MAG: caspase family protein, partial [Cyanobacteria bacterium P01_F01_bin.4]